MQFLIRQKTGLHKLALLFIGSCLCSMLLPAQAKAETGLVADNAQVLNTTAISQYTDPFSYAVNIFTTRVFQGSNDDFDASIEGLANDSNKPASNICDPAHQMGCELFDGVTIAEVTATASTTSPTATVNPTRTISPVATASPTSTASSTSNTGIVWRKSSAYGTLEMGINVPARHLAIYSGKGVTIDQDRYSDAIRAFADTMHQTHDNYTQATIAALNALQNENDRFWKGVSTNAPWCLLGLLLLSPIAYAILAQSMGWGGSSDGSSSGGSSSDDYYRRHRSDSSWSSSDSGGSSSSGGSSDSGGGGGGASGNF